MKRQDLPALTGLRFAAAAAIVMDHLWPTFFKLKTGVPFFESMHQLAFVGMSLFFVMSGFIIHYNYSHSVTSIRGLYAFGVARFSRLYPLLLALIVYDVSSGNWFLYQPDERASYFAALPYTLTATQSWFYGFVGNHPIAFPYNFTNVAWSISTEFFLYLTYPLICLLMMRRAGGRHSLAITVVIIVASAALLSLIMHHTATIDYLAARIGVVENPLAIPNEIFSDWFKYIAPYPRVFEFLTGCAIAQAFNSISERLPSLRERIIGLAALTLALINVGLFVFRSELISIDAQRAVWSVGLLPAISVIVFCCARYEPKPLSVAPIVALGEASYSMYLLHLIVIDKSAPTSPFAPAIDNLVIIAVRTLIVLAAIAVISLGTHRYFEMPARRLMRKLLLPRRRSVIFVEDDFPTNPSDTGRRTRAGGDGRTIAS
jgi:peptidoglycan/LPS O-acetylase OafA/YrhL